MKENWLKGLWISICYSWSSVKGGFVRAGFNCTFFRFEFDLPCNNICPLLKFCWMPKHNCYKSRAPGDIYENINHLYGLILFLFEPYFRRTKSRLWSRPRSTSVYTEYVWALWIFVGWIWAFFPDVRTVVPFQNLRAVFTRLRPFFPENKARYRTIRYSLAGGQGQ